jgi:hypothetical protein
VNKQQRRDDRQYETSQYETTVEHSTKLMPLMLVAYYYSVVSTALRQCVDNLNDTQYGNSEHA